MNEELQSAKERLAEWRRTASAREQIVLLGVDRGNGVVLVGTSAPLDEPVLKEIRRIAGDAPIKVVKARFRFHQGAGDARVRPLVGGIRITDVNTEIGGTLGLVVTSIIGQTGFLTAAHFLSDAGGGVGQPSDDATDIVGNILANGMSGAPFNIDAAFVGITAGVASTNATIWQPTGTPYIVLTQMTNVPAEEEPCSMQGADSGLSAGEVYLTDLDIGELTLQAAATYASQEGDSGAPVFDPTNNAFLGVHSGVVTVDGVDYSVFTQVNGILRVVNFNL
jgi:hypothetical protein